MTENVKISKHTLNFVRESIDTIYEITQEEYKGGFRNKYGAEFGKVATILIKRGSVIKKGEKRYATYKWNPVAMKPTKLFVCSVAEEYAEYKREYNRQYRKKIKNNEMNQIETEKRDEVVVAESPSLQQYTIEQLWNEIKSRGGFIENNRLAARTITYFD